MCIKNTIWSVRFAAYVCINPGSSVSVSCLGEELFPARERLIQTVAFPPKNWNGRLQKSAKLHSELHIAFSFVLLLVFF